MGVIITSISALNVLRPMENANGNLRPRRVRDGVQRMLLIGSANPFSSQCLAAAPPKSPMTLADLPAACRQILIAP